MAKTAKAVMDLAISYLGTKESPANSNNVIFNTHYYGQAVHDGGGATYPWCCAFVWDIFRMAGASSLFYNGQKTAYCPSVQSWGRAFGLEISKGGGQYGDIVLFDWNSNGSPDHIGFIEKRNSDGTYTTVEGNTSEGNDSNGGEVMRRTRYQSQICCILRPKYEQEEEAMTQETFNQMFQAMRQEMQDNDAGKYSQEARQWSLDNGLVFGGGKNDAGEDQYMWQDFLTREQFVTVLYRFAKLLGKA